jgi:hypothetical protein
MGRGWERGLITPEKGWFVVSERVGRVEGLGNAFLALLGPETQDMGIP